MGEVERLKELLARVKPGEWYLMDQECHGDRSVLSYLEVWNEDYDALVATEVRRAHGDGGTDALKLIIETHNALPALLSQLEEMREREKRSREAVTDALAGWRYIRAHHGDLYGVAWDRVEGRLAALLSQTDEVKSDG